MRVSHAGAGDMVLVTAASGGVGSAIGQLLARQGVARVIGRVRTPAQAATLAAAYTPRPRARARGGQLRGGRRPDPGRPDGSTSRQGAVGWTVV
jgi:NAD(P)-dependent dehydrogenase (short-subunit alcohol dehydrogenase family)